MQLDYNVIRRPLTLLDCARAFRRSKNENLKNEKMKKSTKIAWFRCVFWPHNLICMDPGSVSNGRWTIRLWLLSYLFSISYGVRAQVRAQSLRLSGQSEMKTYWTPLLNSCSTVILEQSFKHPFDTKFGITPITYGSGAWESIPQVQKNLTLN